MFAWYLSFFQKQWTFTPHLHDGISFVGETVLITGGTSGLGLACAIHAIRLNAARVIITARDLTKGKSALAVIAKATGRTHTELWELDLSHRASITAFAERASKLDRLDRVLENAGLVTPTFTLVEGVESTVAVSVYGTFHLLLLLMPILQRTSKETGKAPVVSIVTSDLHKTTSFPERKKKNILASLNDKASARMLDRYNVVKLIQVLLVRFLADSLLEGAVGGVEAPVTLNLVSPGLVDTGLQRELGVIMRVFKWLHHAYTPEVGAYDLIDAVAAGPESAGKYMVYCEWTEVSDFARSTEGAKCGEKIWMELSKELGVSY